MKREQEEFTLTKHAQDRIRERFPDAMREVELEPIGMMRVRKMYEFLWNSKIEKRSINDTRFMQFIHEKYGFDKKFRFFANQDMLFIGVISPEGNSIVTVVDRCNFVSRHLRPTEKQFQKKPDTHRNHTRMRRLKPSYEFRMKKNEYLEDNSPDF